MGLACRGYRWVEKFARDPDHPGYFEVLSQEARPILDPPDGDPHNTDMIGTAYGFKSMKSHLHLMEAYAALYQVWPDPQLRHDLEQLLVIVRDTVAINVIWFQDDANATSIE